MTTNTGSKAILRAQKVSLMAEESKQGALFAREDVLQLGKGGNLNRFPEITRRHGLLKGAVLHNL